MFEDSLTLHRLGKLEDAARGYETVLADEPDHVDALVHLGVLRLEQGLAAEAEPLLRQAVALAPDAVDPHANLASALQALGQGEAAIREYLRALEIAPDAAHLRFALASCLQALSRHDEAVVAYETVLAADPGHAEANYGLATLFAKLGRTKEAIDRYHAALAADPDFAEASYGLGTLLAQGGKLAEAVACLRQALDVDPAYADAWLRLGLALHDLNRDDDALGAYRAALAAEPDSAAAHYGLGVVLRRLYRDEEAIQHFRAALAIEPEHYHAMTGLAAALLAVERYAEALPLCRTVIAAKPEFARPRSVLGIALAELGEIADGVAESRRAVELAPDRPEFWYNLVRLSKVQRDDAVFDALEGLLQKADSLSARDLGWLHFALAKAYEDIGERDRGFAHQLQGNAAKRGQFDYNEAAELGFLDRICSVFTPELLNARRNAGDPTEFPVFIVGMPRSGTTLVEQILASHSAVFGAGERVDLPRAVARLTGHMGALPFPESLWTMTSDELRQVAATYIDALRPLAPDALRITDKLPANFQYAGFIHLILPNARIIHLMRDPLDNCLSCFSKLFSGELRFSYDLAELGRYHRAYQRVMAHWRTVLPADVLLEVQYEELVRNPVEQVHRIVAHCGLAWEDACLEFHKTSRPVRTASVTQVRQPIYQSSVGRWQPDPAVIRPLLEALGTDVNPQ